MNPLLLTNVPDPTDFPSQEYAPGLRALDASLRCPICGEVFDGAASLNCGHSFCSYCIRASLAEKQECPTCRKTAIEGHVRPNHVVGEIVASWKLSRPYILDLIKERPQIRDSTPATPVAKKRKLTPDTLKRSGASTSTGKSSLGSPSKPKRVRQSSSDLFGATIPTSEAEEDELVGPSRVNRDPSPDDLVDCPLCSKQVKFKNINQHMDKGCKDPPPVSNRSATSDWKKLMAKPSKGKQKDNDDEDDRYPLPKASYDTLKDKKLKEMLAEYGLPISGDRSQWIQRHQQWVMIYNANLDRSSNTRKSKDELKRDLKKWEEEKTRRKKATVEDIVAHQKQHKNDFARLIEAAKPRPNRRDGASTSVVEKKALLPKQGDENCIDGREQRSRETVKEDAIVVDSEEEELIMV